MLTPLPIFSNVCRCYCEKKLLTNPIVVTFVIVVHALEPGSTPILFPSSTLLNLFPALGSTDTSELLLKAFKNDDVLSPLPSFNRTSLTLPLLPMLILLSMSSDYCCSCCEKCATDY